MGKKRVDSMARPCTSTQHIATLCALQRTGLCGIWRSGGMLTKFSLSHYQPNVAIYKNSSDRVQEKSFIPLLYQWAKGVTFPSSHHIP